MKDQFAFFTLSASSWFRLTSLGLPKSWPGYKYATRKSGMPKEFGMSVPMITGPHRDDDVSDTIKGWQSVKSYTNKAVEVAKDDKRIEKFVEKMKA